MTKTQPTIFCLLIKGCSHARRAGHPPRRSR
jgi:hypothetical protein